MFVIHPSVWFRNNILEPREEVRVFHVSQISASLPSGHHRQIRLSRSRSRTGSNYFRRTRSQFVARRISWFSIRVSPYSRLSKLAIQTNQGGASGRLAHRGAAGVEKMVGSMWERTITQLHNIGRAPVGFPKVGRFRTRATRAVAAPILAQVIIIIIMTI